MFFKFNPDSVINHEFDKEKERDISHRDVYVDFETLKRAINDELHIELKERIYYLKNEEVGREVDVWSTNTEWNCIIVHGKGYFKLVFRDKDKVAAFERAEEEALGINI
jgi:hypothetical protein